MKHPRRNWKGPRPGAHESPGLNRSILEGIESFFPLLCSPGPGPRRSILEGIERFVTGVCIPRQRWRSILEGIESLTAYQVRQACLSLKHPRRNWKEQKWTRRNW